MNRFADRIAALGGMVLIVAGAPAVSEPPLALPLSTVFDPPALYITWTEDPTSTAVIDWHTHETDRSPSLQYRATGTLAWLTAASDKRPFPYTDHWIHRARLADLMPDTTYEFRWGPGSRVFHFNTLPEKLDRPLRVVFGGDTMHSRAQMDAMNRAALLQRPDFIVWGGDLSYADERSDGFDRWIDWFASIKETLITDDGRVVPIVVGIGNHEVRGHYLTAWADYAPTDEFRLIMAPYFFKLFAFPGQPGYAALDFGDYLRLIVLDTDHANEISGRQTDWLRERLRDEPKPRHIIPVYHVTAYPSLRSFDNEVSARVRAHWVPLFEAAGVRLAFENHDHTYKRTFPLRAGRVDFEGIVYMGDGCWGVDIRVPRTPEESWYLVESGAVAHYLLAEIDYETIHLYAGTAEGEIFDRYRLPPTDDVLASAVNQIFPRAFPLADGFWYADWFGVFFMRRFPWIYHADHGWLYASGRAGRGIWLYDGSNGLEWLWTCAQHYPNLYRLSRNDWIFFDRWSRDMVRGRWFFGYSDSVGWHFLPRP